MAAEDVVAGVLARLLLDKPTSHDEHSTPQLHELWMEHLGDAHDADVVAACRLLLTDPMARFPTIGGFLEEVQIQSRDRIRRSIPVDPDGRGCRMCAGMGFVFVEGQGPWTVRPCECNERQHDLWIRKHYRLNHLCSECSESIRRRNRGGGQRRRSEPRRADPKAAAAGMFGDF